MCSYHHSLDAYRNREKDAAALRSLLDGAPVQPVDREAEIRAMPEGPHKAWAMWDDHDGD